MKTANGFSSSETLDSGTGINGRPKAKEEMSQLIRNHDAELSSAGKRSCSSCGRIFNSGKALGGHKAKGKCFVNVRKAFDLNGNGIGDHQSHICRVCGKDFPSVMSLSGHMRAHPERAWRGIQPPPLSQKVDDDHDHDHDDRTSFALESSSFALAAEGLVCLSQGSKLPPLTENDKKCLANKKASIESKKSGFSVSSAFKRRIDHSLFKRRGLKRLVKVCKEVSILKTRNKIDDATGEDHEQEEFMEVQSLKRKKSSDGFVPVKTQIMMKKKKNGKSWKMMLGCSSDPEVTLNGKSRTDQMAPDNGYICSNCGKSFITFQALGGHRSIHTNEKKLRQSTDSSFADHAPVENSKENSKTSSHVGQAPDDNGHDIRSVRREVKISPGEASQFAPKIELPVKASQSSTNIPRILDFDLNEPYEIMED